MENLIKNNYYTFFKILLGFIIVRNTIIYFEETQTVAQYTESLVYDISMVSLSFVFGLFQGYKNAIAIK